MPILAIRYHLHTAQHSPMISCNTNSSSKRLLSMWREDTDKQILSKAQLVMDSQPCRGYNSKNILPGQLQLYPESPILTRFKPCSDMMCWMASVIGAELDNYSFYSWRSYVSTRKHFLAREYQLQVLPPKRQLQIEPETPVRQKPVI